MRLGFGAEGGVIPAGIMIPATHVASMIGMNRSAEYQSSAALSLGQVSESKHSCSFYCLLDHICDLHGSTRFARTD